MSIDIILEADQRLNKNDVIFAFKKCAILNFEIGDKVMHGNFPSSNMFFTICEPDEERSYVIAEGVPNPVTWHVGIRIIFTYVISKYSGCVAEVHQFLNELVKISPAHFILSFQYENVYASNDENGLHFFSEF